LAAEPLAIPPARSFENAGRIVFGAFPTTKRSQNGSLLGGPVKRIDCDPHKKAYVKN